MDSLRIKEYMIPNVPAVEAFNPKAFAAIAGAALAGSIVGNIALQKKFNRAHMRKANKSNPVAPKKPVDNTDDHIRQLIAAHPDEVKQEIANRAKFIRNLINIINTTSKKYKYPGITFDGIAQSYRALLTHYTDPNVDEYDYPGLYILTDVLPSMHPKDGSDAYCEWGFNSGFSLKLFGYDIWDWIEKHPDKNARDHDDTKEYWDYFNNLINVLTAQVKSSEFFYSIECGGDWDDGSIDIIFKPSDKIITLANKTSGYRLWPKKNNNT